MQEFNDETMQDVLKAVIALQGKVRRTLASKGTYKDDPNYNNVHSQLVKMGVEIDVKTTLDYLREAERRGYIEGRGGFYNPNGGGSKRWHFLMLPEEES